MMCTRGTLQVKGIDRFDEFISDLRNGDNFIISNNIVLILYFTSVS